MADLRVVTTPAPLAMKDLFARWRWQEAIFLTYTFDLPFFESYVLPLLAGGGGRSIAVAACAAWLPERIRGWAEASEIREAGETYSLSSVRVPGVFHPKVILAASADRGILLIGSGNLSAYGMATGGELFSLVEWSSEVPSVAQEAWQLCQQISARLPVDKTFTSRVESIGRLVPGLAGVPTERVLLHNLDEPILDQFFRVLPGEGVRELLVWSPFTDRRLVALATLVRRLQPARVVLGVQPDFTSLDGGVLAELRDREPSVDWVVRELVPQATARPGMIHAKGVIVTFVQGEQMAIIGSPNLSVPALLRTAATANLELAVLHRGDDLLEGLFGQDGPITLGGTVDPERLRWAEDPTTEETAAVAATLRLVGARLDGSSLILEVEGTPVPDMNVILDDALTLALESGDAGWRVALPEGVIPRVAELVWFEGRSDPVIVQNLAKLAEARRGPEARRQMALEAIDYGADADILALLDQLAQLAIVSIHDVGRALRGERAPAGDQEAAEAAGDTAPVGLDSIDFARIRQHPRAHAYDSGAGDVLDAPRIVLWLDEVVKQFESLRAHQLRSVAEPLPSDELEEEPPPTEQGEERSPWPVGRRARVMVRNRMQRGVHGLADPRFWSAVGPRWMAMNYVLWLSLLERLWTRSGTPTPILSTEDVASLTTDLLAAFWGDDRRPGHFTDLDEEDQLASAILLTERAADSLTAAMSIRLLEIRSSVAATAPFVVGTYVRAGDPLGLVDAHVVERALVWLDRTEDDPAPYLERLLATATRFSWDRFADNLAWRHGLKAAQVLPEVPYLGRFASGDVLVVKPGPSADGGVAMAVLGAWVQELRRRQSDRDVIQMVWGDERVLIYDARDLVLMTRPIGPAGTVGAALVIRRDLLPADIASTSPTDDRPAEANS